MTRIASLCLALGLAAALSALAIPAQLSTGQFSPAKPAPTAFQLPAGGGLAALPAASGLEICHYRCRNTSTGQVTLVSSSTTQAVCCVGTPPCPVGTAFDGSISWGSNRCVPAVFQLPAAG